MIRCICFPLGCFHEATAQPAPGLYWLHTGRSGKLSEGASGFFDAIGSENMCNGYRFSKVRPVAAMGCEMAEVEGDHRQPHILICHVNVSDVERMATQLAADVLDTSWIMNLDPRSQRAYRQTVAETAARLATLFRQAADENNVGSEFGELMVSMGASKALEVVFLHTALPISELWKAQVSGNEGFDFHTICSSRVIHFGEAKYSANSNPYRVAAEQAERFLQEEKHLRDTPHLDILARDGMDELDRDIWGIVIAFSINAQQPLIVLRHAVERAQQCVRISSSRAVVVVGVSHGA